MRPVILFAAAAVTGSVGCDNPKPRPITTTEAMATSSAPDKSDAKPVTTAKPSKLGSKVTEKSFSVWLQTSGRHTAGGSGTVEAVLVPGDGYKCNDAYPYKFKAGTVSDGAKFDADVVRNARVSKPLTVVSIPISTPTAGTHDVSGTFHFSVCTPEICEIEKRKLTMAVTVLEI